MGGGLEDRGKCAALQTSSPPPCTTHPHTHTHTPHSLLYISHTLYPSLPPSLLTFSVVRRLCGAGAAAVARGGLETTERAGRLVMLLGLLLPLDKDRQDEGDENEEKGRRPYQRGVHGFRACLCCVGGRGRGGQ